MDINKQTGEAIRRIREAKGMSLTELAIQIHKSKASVSKYENGSVGIDLQTLAEIAGALGVSVRSFFFEQGTGEDSGKAAPIRLFRIGADDPDGETVLQVYMYFYGGEVSNVREALIEINRQSGETRMYCDPYEKRSGLGFSFMYAGETIYFDSKYRMILHNHFDQNDIFIMQWADAMSASMTLMGLMTHFAAGQFNSFSAKALLSRSRLQMDDSLKEMLALSKEDIKIIRKRNALYGSTRPQEYLNEDRTAQ